MTPACLYDQQLECCSAQVVAIPLACSPTPHPLITFGGFPKLGVPFCGVPVIRTTIFWGSMLGSWETTIYFKEAPYITGRRRFLVEGTTMGGRVLIKPTHFNAARHAVHNMHTEEPPVVIIWITTGFQLGISVIIHPLSCPRRYIILCDCGEAPPIGCAKQWPSEL